MLHVRWVSTALHTHTDRQRTANVLRDRSRYECAYITVNTHRDRVASKSRNNDKIRVVGFVVGGGELFARDAIAPHHVHARRGQPMQVEPVNRCRSSSSWVWIFNAKIVQPSCRTASARQHSSRWSRITKSHLIGRIYDMHACAQTDTAQCVNSIHICSHMMREAQFPFLYIHERPSSLDICTYICTRSRPRRSWRRTQNYWGFTWPSQPI